MSEELSSDMASVNREVQDNCMDALINQKAEIERLRFAVYIWEADDRYHKKLITELAKELGAYHRNYNLVSPKIDSLLNSAREATKDE